MLILTIDKNTKYIYDLFLNYNKLILSKTDFAYKFQFFTSFSYVFKNYQLSTPLKFSFFVNLFIDPQS